MAKFEMWRRIPNFPLVTLCECPIKFCPDAEKTWAKIDRDGTYWVVETGSFVPLFTSKAVQRISMALANFSNLKKIPKDIFELPLIEPDYEQKLSIVKRFANIEANDLAIEIFPDEGNLVDEENLYHIWLLEDGIKFFPFSIREALDKPEMVKWRHDESYDGLMARHLEMTPMGPIMFVYLKTDSYIPWKQKQKIKNEVFGGDISAFEIISPEMSKKEYECLISFPVEYELYFGLGIQIYL